MSSMRRSGSVTLAVRRDLRRLPPADRVCALAASALALAKLLDEAAADGDVATDKRLSAAAQAARELRATMTELLKAAPKARSAIDDLRARRAKRAAG
jgi:hypothetical protein